MKKKLISLLIALSLFAIPVRSYAFWGNPADTLYLAKILANAITQLQQLRGIMRNARDNLGLMREIHRGINDSLYLIKTVYPDFDPGIYKDWEKVNQALLGIEKLYGKVPISSLYQIQKDSDQSSAEAISLYNQNNNYVKVLDEVGDQIQGASHRVSPGGAAKLSAQAAGVQIHLMNQQLRTQSANVKLQAQRMAIENKKEKDETKFFQKVTSQMSNSLKSTEVSFLTPRFK